MVDLKGATLFEGLGGVVGTVANLSSTGAEIKVCPARNFKFESKKCWRAFLVGKLGRKGGGLLHRENSDENKRLVGENR